MMVGRPSRPPHVTGENKERQHMKDEIIGPETGEAVVLFSGGMDSATLAYYAKNLGYNLILLSFDYGQRHAKELRAAVHIADLLSAEHHVVDLLSVGALLKGSALTDNIEVPEGHYAEDNMKTTVVPNRNAIMLSIAYGVAVSRGAKIVATAVHAGDHAVYPDCRPQFITDMYDALVSGNVGYFKTEDPALLWAPFINNTKAEIAELGDLLGVPYALTWSCYKGGDVHCGQCGTCLERMEAFASVSLQDHTTYASWEDFKKLVAEGKLKGASSGV
jgi:7-cyano-7-deazaguanine synthase